MLSIGWLNLSYLGGLLVNVICFEWCSVGIGRVMSAAEKLM